MLSRGDDWSNVCHVFVLLACAFSVSCWRKAAGLLVWPHITALMLYILGITVGLFQCNKKNSAQSVPC